MVQNGQRQASEQVHVPRQFGGSEQLTTNQLSSDLAKLDVDSSVRETKLPQLICGAQVTLSPRLLKEGALQTLEAFTVICVRDRRRLAFFLGGFSFMHNIFR